MLRSILLSKLHRGTVTECDLNYNGSIKIDEALLDVSGMKEFEYVDVFDINCGARFHTYIIKGERGSGVIGVNGCLLYTSPSPRDRTRPRMPSSA